MWFPAKMTLSCIWVAIPADWVISHWYVCDVDGRTDGRAYGHVVTKICRMDRLPHFLRYGATLTRASRVRGAPLWTRHLSNASLMRLLVRSDMTMMMVMMMNTSHKNWSLLFFSLSFSHFWKPTIFKMKLISAVLGSDSTVNRSENGKQPFPTQSEPNLTAPHGESDVEYLTVHWLPTESLSFYPVQCFSVLVDLDKI